MKKESILTLDERLIDPCVRVCVEDSNDDICLGCGRSRAEIAGWPRLDRAERMAILTETQPRLDALAQKRRQRRQGRRQRAMPAEKG